LGCGYWLHRWNWQSFFCWVLAERGFNIAFVSRNKDKLNQCANELKAQFPHIEVSTHVADFVKSNQSGFFDGLVNELKNKDISILVNNVGLGDIYEYNKIPDKVIADEIVVNMFPQALMTKYLLPLMMNRKHRSLVIDLSSGAAASPLPLYAVYGATKAFAKFLSRALGAELASTNMDFLSLTPLFVTTAMTFNRTGPLFVTARQCVEGCLARAGYEQHTYGHWWHCLQAWIYECLPEWLPGMVIRKVFNESVLAKMYYKKKIILIKSNLVVWSKC